MLKGIAASDGVAVAKAYLLIQPDLSFETVSVEDTSAEEARLDAALEASQNEEYYEDDIRPFFERKWKYLYDFNWEITLKMCELIDIMPCMRRTDTYLMDVSDGTDDFREVIRPKRPGVDTDFVPRRYYQVYQQKFGFLPNLSILDLLFNEGNESVLYL